MQTRAEDLTAIQAGYVPDGAALLRDVVPEGWVDRLRGAEMKAKAPIRSGKFPVNYRAE